MFSRFGVERIVSWFVYEVITMGCEPLPMVKLILVKLQETGELFRIRQGAKLHPDLKKVVKLGGREICRKDGSLINSFHQVELLRS